MHNSPHPVLREYLGNLGVTKAAAYLKITRVSLSASQIANSESPRQWQLVWRQP